MSDGLDDGVRAEILCDTLASVKEDLVELLSVERPRLSAEADVWSIWLLSEAHWFAHISYSKIWSFDVFLLFKC